VRFGRGESGHAALYNQTVILPASFFAHTTATFAFGELDIHILAPFNK